jgi:hypothetical protein
VGRECENACRISRPDHSNLINRPIQLSPSQAKTSATIVAKRQAYTAPKREHHVMQADQQTAERSKREHRAKLTQRKDGQRCTTTATSTTS